MCLQVPFTALVAIVWSCNYSATVWHCFLRTLTEHVYTRLFTHTGMAERAVMPAQLCARQFVSAYVTEHVYTGLVTHMEIAELDVMQLLGGRAKGAEKAPQPPAPEIFWCRTI